MEPVIPGQGSGQPPAPPAPAGQGSGQPELSEVEIGGVKYQVPTAIKDGYLMQSDYTRKTQDLAAKEKDYENRVNQGATDLFTKAWEDELKKGGPQPPATSAGQGDPPAAPSGENLELKELRDKQAAMEQRQSQLEQEKQQAETNQYFSGQQEVLKKEFPGNDWKKVLINFSETYQDGQDPDKILRLLAEESHKEMEALRQQHIQEFVKAKSNPGQRGNVGQDGSPSAVGTPLPPPKTLEEAKNRAYDRVGFG